MRPTLLIAALLAASAVGAQAQTIAPPAAGVPLPPEVSLDPAKQPAGAYTLDGRHVSVLWRIRHMGLSLFTGRMDTVSGKLVLDPAHLANSTISVTLAAASVSTNVLGAGGEHAFDKIIATQALGSEAHPEITFVSRTVKQTGPRTGLVSGDVTLNGVTKPAVMDVTFDGGRLITMRNKHVLAITARTVIQRADFAANLADKVRDSTVGNEVEVILSGEFTKD